MANLLKETTVVTNKVRLGYVHVLEKHGMDGQEAKYSCQVMIPKEDTETIKLMKQAMKNVFEKAKSDKLKGVKTPKTSLRDGDEETNDDGESKVPGHYFINVSSNKKPVVVKRKNGVNVETEDPNDIYSGVYGYVSMNFYAYNTNGNKGISAGLNNILTTGKGEMFGGGTTVAEDFGDLEIDEDFDDDEDDMFA